MSIFTVPKMGAFEFVPSEQSGDNLEDGSNDFGYLSRTCISSECYHLLRYNAL
jgi:hypothetical protein